MHRLIAVFFLAFALAISAADKPKPTKAKAVAEVKLWKFETGSLVFSSPAIGSDDTVYVGSWDGKLYAIY